MKIEGDFVEFKSDKKFFEKEKDGRKPNTVRILSEDEYRSLIEQKPKKIRVANTAIASEYFERDITDISVVGHIAGKNIAVISWLLNPELV